MKKTAFVIILTIFLAISLSACKDEKQEEVSDKSYGVEYSQEEKTIAQPERIICREDEAWVITSVKNDFLYHLNQNAGTVERMEWQQDGNEWLTGAAVSSEALYISAANTSQDTISVRKFSEERQEWTALAEVKIEDEAWKIIGQPFFVDKDENFYLVGENTVTRFSPAKGQECQYKISGRVCALGENAGGQTECVAVSDQGIALYGLGETEAVEKWTYEGSFHRAFYMESSDKSVLCMAADEKILFFERESGRLAAQFDCMKEGMSLMYGCAGIYRAEEESMWLYETGSSYPSCLSWHHLKEQDGEFVKQRTQLVYGASWISPFIEERIISFNKENEDYFITTKLYEYDYNGQRGDIKMMADMAAGNGPDIIYLSNDTYLNFVNKGCLEDLSEYLKQSEWSDDIFWQVLDAYRVDGKLYMLASRFSIGGILIAPEYADSISEWNLDAFLEIIEKNSGEKTVIRSGFGTTTEQELLVTLLYGMWEMFVNAEEKKAEFESEEFINLLELCKEYGRWKNNIDDAAHSSEEIQRACIFYEEWITHPGSYLSGVTVYGRDYKIYGYPTMTGQNYLIGTYGDSCGIYSESKNKEGAWEFIETLLDTDYQKQQVIGYMGGYQPIRISCWEDLCEETKEEGPRRINNYEVEPITDSELFILKDILYHGEMAANLLDYTAEMMILEETAPFFAGDKTAEEAAHIIQSRMQIMLEE